MQLFKISAVFPRYYKVVTVPSKQFKESKLKNSPLTIDKNSVDYLVIKLTDFDTVEFTQSVKLNAEQWAELKAYFDNCEIGRATGLRPPPMQDACPSLSAEIREYLITGVHPDDQD